MATDSALVRRFDMQIVHEVLSICSIDGMTRSAIKSRAQLSVAQTRRFLELLAAKGLILRESNGYFHITAPGHYLLKRLNRPIGTIKREEQMLFNKKQTTDGVTSPVKFPMTRDDPRMLTVSQAARRVNTHPNSVRAWSNAGLLQGYRVGVRGDRRFNADDVDTFMRSRKISGVQKDPKKA